VAARVQSPNVHYLDLARQTQRFTLDRLGYLGGATDCPRAPYLSYLRSDVEPDWTDQWYVTSQMGADTALLRVFPGLGRCTIDKSAAFLDLMWDHQSAGGYLARCRPDASLFLRPDKYSDDHGHAGLMLIDVYEATDDGRYVKRARAAADYLMYGGVWDKTFGGGFWWNNRRGDTVEGKPAQANGLAVDLFAQLYGLTGKRVYREWALKTFDWLEARLFDPHARLYRWSVHFETLDRRRGELVAHRFFNYDQGIIIEALLSLNRHVDSDPAYLRRALELAEQLETAFWHPGEGGFNLERGVEHVMAIYSSWLTPSLLALHQVAPDERWRTLARRNVDALNSYLRAPDGGYYKQASAQNGVWMVDRTRDTAANAGMQRALAVLAVDE
jgi:uncharacterized protein YyaL (SSP411 family)